MKKVLFYILFFLFVLALVILNYGKWIDATKEPIKADLVVCLGGGTIERVKKSITLIEKGYVNNFLLLGESWYNQPYIKKNYPNLNVIIDETPKNTKEEVLFIKKYMIQNGYKTALVVTDPPHSRRVSVLHTILWVKGDGDLTFRMISSDVSWWDKKNYYDNKRSRTDVLYESIKILYSIVVYGILYNLGVDDA